MTDEDAVKLMCWDGAVLFGQEMPPMRDFVPKEPGQPHAEFNPVTFYARHAEPRP